MKVMEDIGLLTKKLERFVPRCAVHQSLLLLLPYHVSVSRYVDLAARETILLV